VRPFYLKNNKGNLAQGNILPVFFSGELRFFHSSAGPAHAESFEKCLNAFPCRVRVWKRHELSGLVVSRVTIIM
jgi:hypothetical protein